MKLFDCKVSSRPWTNTLKSSEAIGQKIGTRNELKTLYGKNPVPASGFLPGEPVNALIHH
jgi:hypothetical protein